MKKLLLLAFLFVIPLHAMETVSLLEITKTSLILSYNGTQIHLTKGAWEDAVDNIDLTVVGNQQQRMLQEELDLLGTIGQTYLPLGSPSYIHIRTKEHESDSDDDTYKPHRQIDTQTWKNSQKRQQQILRIEEPCISYSTRPMKYALPNGTNEMQHLTIPAQCLNSFVYNCQRAIPNKQDMVLICCFKGDQAIQEASKDLSLCYTKALTEGLEYFNYNSPENKNIAFPTLGADAGFPRDKTVPIAIEAVFNFLQDNPNQYKNVHLFVKKRSEFALYKQLLMQYYKPIKVICLLYWMHKDPTQDFSYLLDDIINHITWLMYNS